ncbi:hypothetical protein GCM10027047_23980 [Rhodococcus aerolatus]
MQQGSRAGAWAAAVLAFALAAGCATSTVAGTAATEAPSTPAPGAPAVEDTLPVTAGGTAYQPLALTLTDLPAGWMGATVTATEVAQAPRTTVVDPPACAEIGATRADTAGNAYLVAFSRVDPFNSLFEYVAPTGNPTLDGVQARARQCATFTQTDPSTPEPQTVTTEVVDAPASPSGRSLGVRQRSTTTYQGTTLTLERLELLAEVRGALVSVVGLSGTRDPLDTELVRAAFTTAVTRLAG